MSHFFLLDTNKLKKRCTRKRDAQENLVRNKFNVVKVLHLTNKQTTFILYDDDSNESLFLQIDFDFINFI